MQNNFLATISYGDSKESLKNRWLFVISNLPPFISLIVFLAAWVLPMAQRAEGAQNTATPIVGPPHDQIPMFYFYHGPSNFNYEIPRYTVSVYPDGTVSFYGMGSAVKTTDHARHKLTEAELASFKAKLQELLGKKFPANKVPVVSPHRTVHWSLESGSGDSRVDRNNLRAYVNMRQALEPYLQTMKYRCPVENPIRDFFGKKLDVCLRIVEFDETGN